MSSPAEAPKHNPGQKAGSKTPSAIPTMEEYSARTHNATFARSSPTGVNNGSRKVNVRKPARAADSKPEKNLGLL